MNRIIVCVVVQVKSSEGELRSFPPAHQLQLNNRRKTVVTAATTTDTQSAVSNSQRLTHTPFNGPVSE